MRPLLFAVLMMTPGCIPAGGGVGVGAPDGPPACDAPDPDACADVAALKTYRIDRRNELGTISNGALVVCLDGQMVAAMCTQSDGLISGARCVLNARPGIAPVGLPDCAPALQAQDAQTPPPTNPFRGPIAEILPDLNPNPESDCDRPGCVGGGCGLWRWGNGGLEFQCDPNTGRAGDAISVENRCWYTDPGTRVDWERCENPAPIFEVRSPFDEIGPGVVE